MRRNAPARVPDDAPVVLVASGAKGLRVSAANALARAAGMTQGMALNDARAALPTLIAHLAEPSHDRTLLMRLARWSGRYGPARNRHGTDGLWIDVTGAAHLFGGEAALLQDLVRRLASMGLTARAGLADTLGAAWAMARYGPQNPVPVGGVRETIARFPVEALRLDPAAVVLLHRLGLSRIVQLYGLPRAALERRFRSVREKSFTAEAAGAAAAVLLRLDQALGLVQEPLRALGEPPVLSVRRAYPEPLISADWLAAEMTKLAEELVVALEASGLGVRRVRLVLHRADGTLAESRVGTSCPCRDASHIARLLEEKLAALDAGLGLDVLVLEAESVERLGTSQEGLAMSTYADAGSLIDRLANRLGPDRVLRLVDRNSHIPERAQIRVPALAGAGVGVGRSRSAVPAGPWRRPPLLLPRPERITVMAEIPEGPPARFIWRRVQRTVDKAEGPERIGAEWWRALSQIASARAHTSGADGQLEKDTPAQDRLRERDYYRIEDADGVRYWVFREGRYTALAEAGEPVWYMHGVFT